MVSWNLNTTCVSFRWLIRHPLLIIWEYDWTGCLGPVFSPPPPPKKNTMDEKNAPRALSRDVPLFVPLPRENTWKSPGRLPRRLKPGGKTQTSRKKMTEMWQEGNKKHLPNHIFVLYCVMFHAGFIEKIWKHLNHGTYHMNDVADHKDMGKQDHNIQNIS